MSPDDGTARARHRTRRVGALLLASILAGCGSTPEPASVAPSGPGPARDARSAAPTALPSASVASAPVPARAPRAAAKADPSIEDCIERNIHGKEYDAMNPRDARRKLRRLQVKVDCEQKLAAR